MNNEDVLKEMESKGLKDDFKDFVQRSTSKINNRISNSTTAGLLGAMTSVSVTSLLVNSTTGMSPEILSGFNSGVTMGLVAAASVGAVTAVSSFFVNNHAKKELENSKDLKNLKLDFENLNEAEKFKLGAETYSNVLKNGASESKIAKTLRKARGFFNEARDDYNEDHKNAINDNVKYDVEKAGHKQGFKDFYDEKIGALYEEKNKNDNLYISSGMVATVAASVMFNSTTTMAPEILSNLSQGTTAALISIASVAAVTSTIKFFKSRQNNKDILNTENLESVLPKYVDSIGGNSELSKISDRNAFREQLEAETNPTETKNKTEINRPINNKRQTI